MGSVSAAAVVAVHGGLKGGERITAMMRAPSMVRIAATMRAPSRDRCVPLKA